MKKLIVSLIVGASAALSLLAPASANEGGMQMDHFPAEKMHDVASLQNGAKLFVNYCLNCHAAAFMRFNRMRDIGLTDDQIKKNMLFSTDKVGEVMKVSMDPRQAKEWFGATPPDLSVIARSRGANGGNGADYLYTYLRTFYRDDSRPTGSNNLAFPNVGMPNVLWELQGQRDARFEQEADPHEEGKKIEIFKGFEQATPGKMTQLEFDNAVGDLVAYLQWMGEPEQEHRVRLGVWVLMFLFVFTVIAWRLNAAYWKDVK